MEEDEWLKNLDFHNISAQSLGEVNPDKRLENIENKVKEAVLFTNKLKEKSKLIPLEKFLPILNNVNTISQHNYKYYTYIISTIINIKLKKSVSQSLLIQNRHLQEKLYKVNEDLKCFKNERDHFKSKMEENLRTSNLEIKILSNENDKIKTVMSNYRLENEMLKDILSEKTEIISKKEENLLRLERELQHLSQQNQSNRLKYEEDIAFLTQKYTKNQEEIHILSLNINSKDSEIVRLRDISLLEKKELENEIIRLNSDFLAYKNELVLEKKKLDKLEKTTYAQKCENENIERNSHEKEEKIIKLEKELTEMKENLFKKEKTFINDIEERVHEVQANNIDQIVGLEVKLNQMLQKEEGLENKIEDLINENRELQVKLEEEISEKNYIELQWKVYAEERAKLLADFGFIYNILLVFFYFLF